MRGGDHYDQVAHNHDQKYFAHAIHLFVKKDGCAIFSRNKVEELPGTETSARENATNRISASYHESVFIFHIILHEKNLKTRIILA